MRQVMTTGTTSGSASVEFDGGCRCRRCQADAHEMWLVITETMMTPQPPTSVDLALVNPQCCGATAMGETDAQVTLASFCPAVVTQCRAACDA